MFHFGQDVDILPFVKDCHHGKNAKVGGIDVCSQIFEFLDFHMHHKTTPIGALVFKSATCKDETYNCGNYPQWSRNFRPSAKD